MLARRRIAHPSGLHAQQARDHLEIVLHAVVKLVEQQLALLLGILARGDVDVDADKLMRLAIKVLQDFCAAQEPSHRSVGMNDAIFHDQRLARGPRLCQRAPHLSEVIRMHRLENKVRVGVETADRQAMQCVKRRRPDHAVVLHVPFPIGRTASEMRSLQPTFDPARIGDAGIQQHGQYADADGGQRKQRQIDHIGARLEREGIVWRQEKIPACQQAKNDRRTTREGTAEIADNDDRWKIGRKGDHDTGPCHFQRVAQAGRQGDDDQCDCLATQQASRGDLGKSQLLSLLARSCSRVH